MRGTLRICRGLTEEEVAKQRSQRIDHVRLFVFPAIVTVVPSSLESEFCILTGDDSKKQPLLESRCEELLESVEGLTEEEVAKQRSQRIDHVHLFVFPAIVTDAKIMACQFKAKDVQLWMEHLISMH